MNADWIHSARVLLSGVIAIVGLSSQARAGQFFAELALDTSVVLPPGGSTTARVVIEIDGDVGLFGYSLAVKVTPQPGATGTVKFDLETTIDPATTNLYLPKNLIAAYPAPLDPVFTVIWPDGASGVFINANIDFFSRAAPDFVTVTPNINDVLVELVFDASAEATGTFAITLGPATALSDGDGFAVPFSWAGGTITIDTTPAPSPDLNGDGQVSAADLAILLGDWGNCPSLPPDLDGNGVVGSTDLGIFLGAWGATGGPADFNQDGMVGPQDLANLLGEWGNFTPPCGDLNEDGVVTASDLAILLGAWTR